MKPKVTVREIAVPTSLDLTGKSVFLHGENKIVGSGKFEKITASGPNRVSELAAKWQLFLDGLEIQSDTQHSTPGVVGLTSIAFSDNSEYESSITICRSTVVIKDSVAFEISFPGEDQVEVTTELSGSFQEGNQSSADFKRAVGQALEQIREGKLEKVVLARDLFLATGSNPDLAPTLKRLHERYPACWIYAIGGVFGASPELLLRAERGEVSARVLAGTAGRGTDPDVDRAIADGLSHSLKNKHEHVYAVQSLVDELRPFCLSVEADQEPFSLALPDLWHLATDVRGKLRAEVNLLDVIAALHPTAAVAGTPRDTATEMIDQLEPFDRAGYAGPVGWLSSDGSGEIAIALRGAVIEKGGIRAMAGCGIVSESDPEAELAETELKFRAIRSAIS